MRPVIITVLIMFLTTGCETLYSDSNGEIDMSNAPTAAEILNENSKEDIFQFNNLLYSRYSENSYYKKGKQVGRITKQTEDSYDFKNGSANKLPVGTKIYQTIGEGLSILIIEEDGKNIIYIVLLEN